MRHTILAAACLAVLPTTAFAYNLGAPTTEALSSPGLITVAGDVNGDQLDDVVIATGLGGADPTSLLVYLQRPDGSLAPPLKYGYGTQGISSDMVLADMNKDGVLDVVHCHDGGLTVLVSNGTGFTKTATAMGSASAPWSCRALGVFDVNGDGNADVVSQSGSNSGGMSIVTGNGKGGFSSATTRATPTKLYVDLKVGDVTGDGRPDVVLLSDTGIDVYPGTGSSLGSAKPYPISNAASAREVVIGDFNNDGRNDIAVSIMDNAPGGGVWFLSQTSTGALDSGRFMAADDLPAGLVAIDLDRNNRTDLLVGHLAGPFGYYLQGNTGLANETVPLQAVGYDGSHRSLASADLNDDGCPDAVALGSSSGRNILLGSECRKHKTATDFEVDGKSDLVWRNTQTGANVIWRAADSMRPQAVATVPSQAWQIAGVADFDGDVAVDLLWHNVQTGANTIWLSGNSANVRAMAQVTNLDWQIVGVGDFDGDGIDDVLWRNRTTGANAIWKSALLSAPMAVATLADAHWKVVGVGDFDHDYRADILWRNDATGANMYWPAANAAASHALTGVTSQSWTVAGVGDFDGDGYADIFWRNVASGANTIWRAANSANLMPVTTVTGNWNVVVGDYNGDGKSDVVWRNAASGIDVLWRAGQATVQLPVTDVASPAWKLVR